MQLVQGRTIEGGAQTEYERGVDVDYVGNETSYDLKLICRVHIFPT